MARTLERRAAREHLVHDDAERVDIGACVDAVAADLLGSHVARAPEDLVRFGQVLLAVPGDVRHQAEVEYLHEVCVVRTTNQEDVARLQIAMHDAGRVRLAQGAAHLPCDVDDASIVQEPALADGLAERAPDEVLHGHVVDVVVGAAALEHRDDVRMIQSGGDSGFEAEALVERPADLAGVGRVEELDRTGAAPLGGGRPERKAGERRLLGSVHAAHAAARDEREEPIPPAKAPADHGIG